MTKKTYAPGSLDHQIETLVSELKDGEAIAERMIKDGYGTDEQIQAVAGTVEKAKELKRLRAQYQKAKPDMELVAKLKSFGAPDDSGRVSAEDHLKHAHGLAAAMRHKAPFAWNVPFTKEAYSVPGLSLPASTDDAYPAPAGSTAVALRDLFTLKTVPTGQVRYYQIGAGTGADIVAEGESKPELSASITPKTVDLSKIAVQFGFTDEFEEDAGFLLEFIQQQAYRSVLARENTFILSEIDGTSGLLTGGGDKGDIIDILATEIGQAEALNGVTPAHIVANPADVALIRTIKAEGSGTYAVDPLNDAPAGVHGVPLLSTPAVASGTVYLVSDGAGVFYSTSRGLRIEAGYSGDDWIKNKMTVRVEERVHPAIVNPSLITKVTLAD